MRAKLTQAACTIAAAFLLIITVAVQREEAKPWIGILAKGTHSGHPERQYYVIRDKEAFEALWDRVHSVVDPAPPAPELDFTRVMVIAVFQGEKPTGGYEITIKKRTVLEDRIQIRVFESSPDPGCGVTGVLSQPFFIISVPKSDLPVKFKVKQRVSECD